MTEISEDVCYIHDDYDGYKSKQQYHKSIKYYNNLLIDLNNPLKIFDPETMIDLFNTKIDWETCTFCKYKIEWWSRGPQIFLYGKSEDALSIFYEFCDYYDGKNDSLEVEVTGTEIHVPQIPNPKSFSNYGKKNFSSFYEGEIVYKLIFNYYKCFDWLKHVLTEEILRRKKNCRDQAIEDGVL